MGKIKLRDLTQKELTVSWAFWSTKNRLTEKDYSREALKLFMQEKEDLQNALKSPKKAIDSVTEAALLRMMTEYKPGGKYHEAWLERFYDLINTTMVRSAADLGVDLGADFNLSQQHLSTAAYRRATELADLVSETTANQITDIITQERDSGGGIADIGKRINTEVFGSQMRDRSIMIARTETVGSSNEGETIAARDNGFDIIEWMSQGDGNVRPDHVAMNGLKVSVGTRFPNGCRWPGDRSGGPAQIVNCRCTAIYHKS